MNKPLNICSCGSTEFFMKYVERAWAKVSGNQHGGPDIIRDGYSVDDYELDTDTAKCAQCYKKHQWKEA